MTLREFGENVPTTTIDEMYQVCITGYRLAEIAYGKPYYVYAIEVTDESTSIKYSIERRYSQFNSLHRALKKETGTAPFPPKRVRNSQPKVLEQRRAALEFYIQKMLQISTTKQQVLEFLGIESTRANGRIDRTNGRKNPANHSANCAIGHHPVIEFRSDPYVKTDITRLPDIVTQGALLGIYKPENY